MNERCDNCKNYFRDTERMWLAYRSPKRVALCDECYNEMGQPKTYQETISLLQKNESDGKP